MNFSESIMAALIAAGATVLAALVQLRMSWRRELKERERGQPITKKARRGPVLFVFALMIAAAVGGFALSQYFLSLRNGDRDTLRSELQSKLSEISASAARLEHARLGEREQVEAAVRRASMRASASASRSRRRCAARKPCASARRARRRASWSARASAKPSPGTGVNAPSKARCGSRSARGFRHRRA